MSVQKRAQAPLWEDEGTQAEGRGLADGHTAHWSQVCAVTLETEGLRAVPSVQVLQTVFIYLHLHGSII